MGVKNPPFFKNLSFSIPLWVFWGMRYPTICPAYPAMERVVVGAERDPVIKQMEVLSYPKNMFSSGMPFHT